MNLSICTTNLNCGHILKKHLDSIYSQFDSKNFEYIVVDSNSTDNSMEIFKEYNKKYGNIKIIERKCSRGRGRQIAFENASNEIIVVVDTDTIYKPYFRKFVDKAMIYPFCIQGIYAGVYKKNILKKVGGWQDLQFGEDATLWYSLIDLGKCIEETTFKFMPLKLGNNTKKPAKTDFIQRYRKLKRRNKDWDRSGIKGKKRTGSYWQYYKENLMKPFIDGEEMHHFSYSKPLKNIRDLAGDWIYVLLGVEQSWG